MPGKVAAHVAVWAAILAGWLLVTRPYHPTATIWVLATGILVVASALAVYLHRYRLRPAFRRHRSWVRYAASLAVLLGVLDVVAVLSIQAVYDVLWGPDPNRFGFWFNVGSDGVIIALHLVGAGVVWWVAERARSRPAVEP